jgi:acyl carrier protein
MNAAELRAAILSSLGEIAPEAELDRLAGDVPLREALDLDSIDFLRFLQRLAAATGVEVPEAEYAKVATLDACIAYFAART